MQLGEILIGKGIITAAQMETALAEQKKNPGERIGAILLKLGYVTEAQVKAALG
ncbi:MAG: hypothetical protein NT080_02795 [Spirochaetes bacterium]|nr:hypothetical protein [Spirochaetota bacterium]